ncbi:hypothetical protein ABFX02_08G152300 [Erythranthe guttata]
MGLIKAQWILIIVALLYFVTCANSSDFWKPVKDVNAPLVRRFGKYAIKTYNKINHTNLKFVTVEKAKFVVARGAVVYRLVIEAKDGNIAGKYKAGVTSWIISHDLKYEYCKPIPEKNVLLAASSNLN